MGRNVERIAVNYVIPEGMKSEHRLVTPGGSWMAIRAVPPCEVEVERMDERGDITGPNLCLDWIQEAMESIRKEAMNHVR